MKGLKNYHIIIAKSKGRFKMKNFYWRYHNIFFSAVIVCMGTMICLPVRAQNANSPLKTIIIDAGHGLPDPGARGAYSNESDIALAIAQKLYKKLTDSLPECKILMTRTNRNLPGGLQDKDEANRWRAKFANENHGNLFICIHCNDVNPIHHSEVVGHRTRVYYTGRGRSRKRHTRHIPIYKYWTTPNPVVGTETYVWGVNKNDSKQKFIQDNQDSSELMGESVDSSNDYFTTSEEKILAALRAKKYFARSLLFANLIENEYISEGRTSRGVKQREKGIWVLHATAMPSILTEVGFLSNPKEEDYLNSQSGQDQVSGAILRAVIKYKKQLDTGIIKSTD
ncbi:N-acetylmuramoyl-L-alanine amidase family protein [Arachidicoccus sp.]|jgi:N-acetylmuramoyl-L-alanine amidase|uniref:N-acetylmuramoyl-L-alanine amidase family protein n=1 Tax=Arachidicoccus sp. TaxID=1872624 RepID=UPI003D1C1954